MNLYQPIISGSLTVSGSVIISGSLSSTAGFTGSFSGTATTASYALTSSYLNPLNQTLIVSGSTSMTGSLQVTGSISTTSTITAQTLVVQTVTSSVVYSSGSNIFGNQLTNTQQMTGSLKVTGSITQTGTSAVSSFSGNVGIGTTSLINPSAKLEVKGDTFITPTGSVASKLHLYNNDSTNETYVYDSGSSSNSILAFAPGGAITMVVNSSGNVGIGNTTANAKLDVASTYVSDTTTQVMFRDNTGGGLLFGGTGGAAKFIQAQDYTGAATYYNLLLNPRGGNVGIGTSSPLDTYGGRTVVTINNNGAYGAFLNFGYNGTLYGSIEQNTDILKIANYQNIPTAFFTNSAERMRITSGGNVYIAQTTGTNASMSAAGSLQVGKEIISCGSLAGLFWENRSGGVTSTTNWYGWYTSSGTIYLYSNNANIGNFNASSGNYTPTSDINRKKDFELYTESGLNAILGLKPTLYRMKSDDESVDKQLGFIAQEVKEFIPQAYVETKGENENFIGLNQMPIIAALTKAIQELSQQNKELNDRLTKAGL